MRGGKRIADFQTIQKRVGEAAARIDACRLVAQHAVDAANSRFGTTANHR